MTRALFKKLIEMWGDNFYKDTCPKLQAEIVRKIVNCRAIDDFRKITLLNQYIGNLSTNNCVVEAIKQFNDL